MPDAAAGDRSRHSELDLPIKTAEVVYAGLFVPVLLILGALPIGLVWPSSGWLFRAFIGLLFAPWPAAWLTRVVLRRRMARISFFDVASATWLTFFTTLLIARVVLYFAEPRDPWQ